MEIKGPALYRNPAELLLNAASQTADGKLLPGRVLSLVVVSINEQQLVLRLNDNLISARLQLATTTSGALPPREAQEASQNLQRLLQPGLVVRAEVVTGADKQVALKLLPLPATGGSGAILDQLRPALRQNLPRQQSAAPLLANLQALAQRDSPLAMSLPPRVQQQVRDFIAHLPTVEAVRQADGLREAIRNSGLFTEHNLLGARADPSTASGSADVRLGLLRIAHFLRQMADKPTTPARSSTTLPASYRPPATQAVNPPAVGDKPVPTSADTGSAKTSGSAPNPPAVQTPTPQPRVPASLTPGMAATEARSELLQQVEASLARIHSQQLTSQATQAETARPALVFDLPLRSDQGIDVFQLRIQRDAHNEADEDGSTPWSVSLAFELESLGPVRVLVSLLQRQVSVSFWAESADTTRLFTDHLAALQEQLDTAGLQVGRLQCRHGQPTAAEFHTSRTPGLVDETA